MTCHDLFNDDEPTLDGDLADEAAILLRGWFPAVRILPALITQTDRREAAWGLVVWYQRVFEDPDYAANPPIEGLDALIDELSYFVVASEVHIGLARARWAIRVAEELVDWRKGSDDTGGGGSMNHATDRLEVAIEGARRQLSIP